MGELMKTEKVLEGNLCSMFMLVMSLCDADTKNQVEIIDKYPDLQKKMIQLSY